MIQSRIKEHPVISCCLLTTYSKSYKRKTNDNPINIKKQCTYMYMSCHSKFVPLCSTLSQNYAHNKLLFWGWRWMKYNQSTAYSFQYCCVLVHAVQITTGPQYLTSSVSSSSSLITGLALERDFLFLELSDFSFFYNIQYICTCITKHCLIQVVKGTKFWIIKSKNKNYSRNHTFLDFSLLCFLLVEAPIEKFYSEHLFCTWMKNTM